MRKCASKPMEMVVNPRRGLPHSSHQHEHCSIGRLNRVPLSHLLSWQPHHTTSPLCRKSGERFILGGLQPSQSISKANLQASACQCLSLGKFCGRLCRLLMRNRAKLINDLEAGEMHVVLGRHHPSPRPPPLLRRSQPRLCLSEYPCPFALGRNTSVPCPRQRKQRARWIWRMRNAG